MRRLTLLLTSQLKARARDLIDRYLRRRHKVIENGIPESNLSHSNE